MNPIHLSSQKPDSVVNGVRLLWIAFGIGILRSLLGFNYYRAMVPDSGNFTLLMVLSMAITVIFQVFILNMISEGKNWARITYLVLFIVGFFFGISAVYGEFNFLPVLGLMGLAQFLLVISAFVFLFSYPSNKWFRGSTIQTPPASIGGIRYAVHDPVNPTSSASAARNQIGSTNASETREGGAAEANGDTNIKYSETSSLPADLAQKLDERFIKGEISESIYLMLVKRYSQDTEGGGGKGP